MKRHADEQNTVVSGYVEGQRQRGGYGQLPKPALRERPADYPNAVKRPKRSGAFTIPFHRDSSVLVCWSTYSGTQHVHPGSCYKNLRFVKSIFVCVSHRLISGAFTSWPSARSHGLLFIITSRSYKVSIHSTRWTTKSRENQVRNNINVRNNQSGFIQPTVRRGKTSLPFSIFLTLFKKIKSNVSSVKSISNPSFTQLLLADRESLLKRSSREHIVYFWSCNFIEISWIHRNGSCATWSFKHWSLKKTNH